MGQHRRRRSACATPAWAWFTAASAATRFCVASATFKVLIEYDGTRYSGWQDQKNARTIMGELRKAASELFKSDVEIHGAPSRVNE